MSSEQKFTINFLIISRIKWVKIVKLNKYSICKSKINNRLKTYLVRIINFKHKMKNRKMNKMIPFRRIVEIY